MSSFYTLSFDMVDGEKKHYETIYQRVIDGDEEFGIIGGYHFVLLGHDGSEGKIPRGRSRPDIMKRERTEQSKPERWGRLPETCVAVLFDVGRARAVTGAVSSMSDGMVAATTFAERANSWTSKVISFVVATEGEPEGFSRVIDVEGISSKLLTTQFNHRLVGPSELPT